jgi:hypothetical protein
VVELNDVIGCCKAEKKDDLALRQRKANFNVVSHSIQTALLVPLFQISRSTGK